MKSFFWRFTICILPCVLAAWVTALAVNKYYQGESGGFKLGVDLVGGTILVYEIDLRKSAKDKEAEAAAKGGKKDDKKKKDDAAAVQAYNPQEQIQVLAEALKRRIDPNDLKNITIRPSGGEGRVEIVLPTGGTYRAKIAAEKWKALIADVAEEMEKRNPNLKVVVAEKQIEVGRGRFQELSERVQEVESKQIWQKVFSEPDAWKRMIDNAALKVDAYWPILGAVKGPHRSKFEALLNDPKARGDLPKLGNLILQELEAAGDPSSEKVVQAWLKQQAWEEMMARARERWPFLKPYKEDMDRIPPDNSEQLQTFIESKGVIVAQAGLAMLRGFTGEDIYSNPPADKITKVREFIEENYGRSIHTIARDVQKTSESYGTDLTVEDVQRIKDLVAKVGRLEFRVLANYRSGNQGDDTAGIDDAMRMINVDVQGDAKLAEEIKDAQFKGLPPPGPREADGTPKKYKIRLARGFEGVVTYSWVELGPLERRTLNLDNAAKNDPLRSRGWNEAYLHRGKALFIPEQYAAPSGQGYLLQKGLFYSRKCEDRNLPEDERRKKDVEYFVLSRDPEFRTDNPNIRTPDIDGGLLSSAHPDKDNAHRPIVGFAFNPIGADLFGTLTRKNVTEGSGPESTKKMRFLAIILDGLVMSAPTINSEIRDRGSISGSFTQKQVDELVNILRAGRLPATLKPQPVSESTIGATLGEDTIVKGVMAIGLAFVFILLFMAIYYRFAGLVACVALFANLLLTVGFMVFVQATFTLPGMAGLVLMIGMAVDANILIYERLREERERGASLALAIRNGYDRALPTIIDTHLSSIFTAIVLYVVGNDQLKGFGVSLTVGLIISLFTSLYMTRTIFDFWLSRGWLHKLGMFRLFAKPDIDFMGIRYLMFGLTAAASIIGLALFIGRLPNDLNIDFVGGTAYGGKLVEVASLEELRDLLSEDSQKNLLGFGLPASDPKAIKVEEDPVGDGRRFILTYPSGDKRTVSLANPPDKKDYPELADRLEVVRKRASELPDPSVELIFTQEQKNPRIDSTHSDQFVIRTSEMEVELVQAALDQLLRDGSGNPLLKKIVIEADKLEKRDVKLYFKDPKDRENKVSHSPSFVKTLLTRELKKQLKLADKDRLPFIVEVTGEGTGKPDETYEVVKVTFSEMKDEYLKDARAALLATEQAFQDRPQPDRLENFDSQLATDTRYRAMAAIIASWGAILVYLWFRFGSWTFGLAAVLCLVHDLCFTLGAIALAHYIHYIPYVGQWLLIEDFKLDLPAVAALLTLAGYSTNDTIVVFDRIKEVRGKNPDLTPKMLNDSVNQTLSRTVLASFATWLVVFVLYVFGGASIRLFAYVMVVGVIVGTYSSIYIASPLLLLFREGRHEEPKAREPLTQAQMATAIRSGPPAV